MISDEGMENEEGKIRMTLRSLVWITEFLFLFLSLATFLPNLTNRREETEGPMEHPSLNILELRKDVWAGDTDLRVIIICEISWSHMSGRDWAERY